MKKIFTIAFVGRSGAGKSYAANYLRSKGVKTIDCDDLAKRVVEVQFDCLGELAIEFGDDILYEDGTLNRQMLAMKAFSNAEQKSKLDRITHPYILSELNNELKKLELAGESFCIIEAAALFESKQQDSIDKIVLISSSYESCFERIIERDSIDKEKASMRLAMQMKDNELLDKVDMVIYNNGSKEDFEKKLNILFDKLQEWSIGR